jgi:hypothetical protein
MSGEVRDGARGIRALSARWKKPLPIYGVDFNGGVALAIQG